MLSHTDGVSRLGKLAEKMSGALVQFIQTGNPNGGGLPNWSRYSEAEGETMVINDTFEVKNDPDDEAKIF